MTGWRDRAACKGLDTNLFFPDVGQTVGPVRDICNGCPVSDDCLTYALDWRIKEGVWGGLSENERRRIRARRPRNVECPWCFTQRVVIPRPNAGAISPYCDDNCRRAHRAHNARVANRLRMQDARAHARPERDRAHGHITLDHFEGDVA